MTADRPARTPRFSIVTPVYDPPADVLQAMLDSVTAQTYTNWQHCIVDDASPSPHVRPILERAARKDPRLHITYRTTNGGIVAASNDALEAATGDFIALLDHDDTLHPHALTHVDTALTTHPDTDYLYTDEDKIDAQGAHRDPFYKPDWSPERFRTQMYTCHLSVLRRSLVTTLGGFDPTYEGSQDWDLALRVTEHARHIHHIPHILYHWRALPSSAAGQGEAAKPWAFEAGQRAVQAHCDRTGLRATVSRDATDPGVLHLTPVLDQAPPVSIVIPTGGQKREVRARNTVLVSHCVRSIVETSTYPYYEIVCVADTSTPAAVTDELRSIAGDRLHLVAYDRPFSFSEKINLGAIHSGGDHLLLLNDDMEVITPNWIERLLMYATQPDIGAVGAKLLYDDGRIQHAGVLFHQGRPGHIYRGFSSGFRDSFSNSILTQNYLAVTGACLMTPRDLFEQLGGLSLELPVNFDDIDYCLKVRDHGQRVVYDPDTVLYHFESSSRHATVEHWEIGKLQARWEPMINPDPFATPVLTPMWQAEETLPQVRSTKVNGLTTSAPTPPAVGGNDPQPEADGADRLHEVAH